MVVEDVDAALLSKMLKHALFIHGLFRGQPCHHMDVLELCVVVNEHRGHGVTFLGKRPLKLGNETHLSQK